MYLTTLVLSKMDVLLLFTLTFSAGRAKAPPTYLVLHQACLPIIALLFDFPCFRIYIGGRHICRNFLGIHGNDRFIRLIRHGFGNIGLERRLVLQLLIKAQLIFKVIILTNLVGADARNLPAPICQVDKALIAKLELAFKLAMIAVRNEICLAQRCVWFHAQLSRLHHCP